MEKNFTSIFESAALKMLAAFKEGEAGIRPDEIGSPREEIVRTFLGNWLPNKYGITKGYLVNHVKDVSKECDIIIFDSLKCPKFFLNVKENTRIVPINYTYCTIEVKSILSKKEIKNTISKVESVNNVHRNYIIKSQKIENWVDKHLLLAENPELNIYSKVGRNHRIREDKFYGYKAKILEESKLPSLPIRVLFSFDLDPKLSLEYVKDAFQELDSPPDIIAILNKGVLTILNKLTIGRIIALENSIPIETNEQSFQSIMIKIASKQLQKDYWNLESNAQHKNLSYFYAILMDLLNNQILVDYSVPADIVSIWQNFE